MTLVAVDLTSPVPPFEQIRAQLAEAIARGALEPGARLPTVRQLAADLDVAPNTVGRAYRALEEAALVRTAGRHGTVVADAAPVTRSRRRAALREAAERYRADVARLGFTVEDAMRALQDRPSG
jgi:GntR family transcriptional regulator